MLLKIFNCINKALSIFQIELRRFRSKEKLYQKNYSAETLAQKPFYNIGAGGFSHPYWTNIDFVSDWYKEVQNQYVIHHDLMSLKPLPIKTGTAELIYTSHAIEHVTELAVKNLFKECFRALKSGGGLRVTTGPDAELDFRAMIRGDEDWFYWDKMYSKKGTYENFCKVPADSVSIELRWLRHAFTQLAEHDISPSKVKFSAEQVHQIIQEKGFLSSLEYFESLCEFNPERPGNHISAWTQERVERLLRGAGFEVVYRSGYGQSAFPVLRDTRFFDNTHPQMSLYIEAIKQ